MIYSSSSSSLTAVSSRLSDGEVLLVRGSGEGANEREERLPEGFPELYTEEVSSVYGGFHQTRLDATGGALERRSALSAGVWVAVPVAAHLGQKMVGVSTVAGKTVRGRGMSVHGDARRGWHRVGSMVPCRCA
jgi:hypothetical protein